MRVGLIYCCDFQKRALIFRCSGPSPFSLRQGCEGEVRRGGGVFWAPELPHPHPSPPLEGEGVFQRKIDANQVKLLPAARSPSLDGRVRLVRAFHPLSPTLPLQPSPRLRLTSQGRGGLYSVREISTDLDLMAVVLGRGGNVPTAITQPGHAAE